MRESQTSRDNLGSAETHGRYQPGVMGTQIDGLQTLHPCDAEAVAHIIAKLARGDMGTEELDHVLDMLARASMGGGNHP